MSSDPGLDIARFGRTLILIAFVTGVFLFLSAERLDGELFGILAVAIGVVALITAQVGFLIAAGTAWDE